MTSIQFPNRKNQSHLIPKHYRCSMICPQRTEEGGEIKPDSSKVRGGRESSEGRGGLVDSKRNKSDGDERGSLSSVAPASPPRLSGKVARGKCWGNINF